MVACVIPVHKVVCSSQAGLTLDMIYLFAFLTHYSREQQPTLSWPSLKIIKRGLLIPSYLSTT